MTPSIRFDANDIRNSEVLDIEKAHQVFRFPDLPAEIRNHTYRISLGEMRELRKNPSFDHPSESQSLKGPSPEPEHGKIGHIQGVYPYKVSYNRVMCLVNRQISDEFSSLVYGLELTWIVVSVNWANFSRNLVKAGFPVASRHGLSKLSAPTMSIGARIPDLAYLQQSDSFVVNIDNVQQLVRAIWLTRGREQMEVDIRFHPIPSNVPKHKAVAVCLNAMDKLIGLRGVKSVTMTGVPSFIAIEYSDLLIVPKIMQTGIIGTDEAIQILEMFRRNGKQACAATNWQAAHMAYSEATAFANDCIKLDPLAVAGLTRDNRHGCDDFGHLVCLMASNLALVENQLGDYHAAIRRATYALTTVGRTPDKDRAKAFYRRGIA